jgi:hypothetical protein
VKDLGIVVPLIKAPLVGCHRFTLDVVLPIGVASAEITVPALGGHSRTDARQGITCNGKVVWSDGKFTASAGIKSAAIAAGGSGVVFIVSNGVFAFVSESSPV